VLTCVLCAGLPVSELFDQFEEEPVASGTIGQIHRATLGPRGARNTGCPVGASPLAKPASRTHCCHRHAALQCTGVQQGKQSHLRPRHILLQ